jgi:hypothetical protein
MTRNETKLESAFISVAWTLAIALAMAVMFLGCATMHAGASCTGNAASCTDAKSALACESGKYEAFACTGALGCQQTDAGAVLCDQDTGAVANTACAPAYNGLAQCAGDKSAVLLCQGGAWTPILCPVSTSCQSNSVSVWCG